MRKDLLQGGPAVGRREMRRDVGDQAPRHARAACCPRATFDDPVVDRPPRLGVLDDVSGCRHVELDVNDALCDGSVEISLGGQREVVGIAKQTEDSEVPLEEHRKSVEPEPRLDTLEVGRRRPYAMSLGERQHRRGVDGPFQMHVQLGLRHRADDVDRKRCTHRVRVGAGVRRRDQPFAAVAIANAGITVRVAVLRQGIAEHRDGLVALIIAQLRLHDPFDRRREVASLDDHLVGDLLRFREILDRGGAVVPAACGLLLGGHDASFRRRVAGGEPTTSSAQDDRPNRDMLPARPAEASVKALAELVGRQLHPVTTLTSLVHDHTGCTEHRQEAGDSEDLGPSHDHLRYGTDDRLDDAARRARRSGHR